MPSRKCFGTGVRFPAPPLQRLAARKPRAVVVSVHETEPSMSTDRDALLAAICAHPDEDTPRLALADWCAENGDPDRAEFIRLQFEAEKHAEYTPARMDLDERA